MKSHSTRTRNLSVVGGGLLATALALASGVGGSTAAWAADAPTAGLDYVALGDSYAVGLGLPTPTGAVAGCGQSTSSYPRLLAAALELNLTDMTCSGATTANVIGTPQDTGAGVNPAQSSALSADTDIVTLTIGGNDLGFSDIISTCIATSASGPLAFVPDPKPANCKSVFAPDGGTDTLAAAIAGPISSALGATLATISAAAPNAKIFVVAYPALMPDAASTPPGGCFTPFTGSASAFPFTDIDIAYLHGIQVQFNTEIQVATSVAGANFVSMFLGTVDDTPCANNPGRIVEGASLLPVSMHPNASGTNLMASQASDAIQAELAAPTLAPAATTFSAPAGVNASFGFTAAGFPTPTLSTSGSLPAGMTFDPTTGVLSGAPSTPGSSTFSVTATNAVGSISTDYTVMVTAAPAITSAAPPCTGTVGKPYAFTVTATGFPAPTFEVTAGALPDGLSLDPASGAIAGEPAHAGAFSFSITAGNGIDPAATAEYTITVAKPAVVPSPPKKPTEQKPTTQKHQTLATSGSSPLAPLALIGVLAALAGAGLITARKFAKK